MALLTRIEDILSIPMEMIHNRPGFQPVDLARRAVRSMEAGSRKGIHKTYAPNQFQLLLNPVDFEELYPFVDLIRSEIKGELRRVVEERDYLLAGALQVEVLMDEAVEKGRPDIKARMVSDISEEDDPPIENRDQATDCSEPEPDRDAGTVIMMPPNGADRAGVLEKGLTLLKEGRAREALTVLGEAEDSLTDRPPYHAAMAVALDMDQRREEALPHYRRLRALDGPQPLVQRRLEWAARTRPPRAAADTATFELTIGPRGAALMNPDLNPQARVDGRVAAAAELKPGCEIRIGDLVFNVHKA